MSSQHTLFEYFKTLDEENLYAVVGGNVSFERPKKRGNSLGFKVAYKTTTKAIKAGKAKFKKVIAEIKNQVCERWSELKSTHGRKIKTIDIFDLLYPIVEKSTHMHQTVAGRYDVIAIIALILKGGKIGLDTLCKES